MFRSWPPQFYSSNSISFMWLTSSFVCSEVRVHPSVHNPPTCYVVFLLAFLLWNFLLKSSLECIGSPSLLTWPARFSLFIRICVERGISLYFWYSSSLCLIRHTPCLLVGPDVFWRIFRWKGSILFIACLVRVHASLSYTKHYKWGFYIMSLKPSN